MKTLKGDKLRYGRDSHISENGYIAVGVFIIVATIIGTINILFLKSESSVNLNNIFAIIIFIGVGCLILCSGLKLKLAQKKHIKKYLYIKENGLKAQGKIIKGYSFSKRQRYDEAIDETSFYQLKISYYDKEINKIGTFITLPLVGDINEIGDDKVDVYYYKGEAVFDNLVVDDKEITFEEGIHIGTPESDTPERIELEKQFENLTMPERLKLLNKFRKNNKKRSKIKCNVVTYVEK